MEYMQSYASDDNASNVSEKKLDQRAVWSVYLVTTIAKLTRRNFPEAKVLQMKW